MKFLGGNPLIGQVNFSPKATSAGVYIPIETTIALTCLTLLGGMKLGQKITEKVYVTQDNGRTLSTMKSDGDAKSILGIVVNK